METFIVLIITIILIASIVKFGWIALFLSTVLSIGVVYKICKSQEKSNIENSKNLKLDETVLLENEQSKYLGGFSDIEGGKDSNILIYQNYIKLNILKDKWYSYEKTLYISDIKSIGIKSETQIQSEIGLGKLLVFGFLAFGMKNKKTIVNNYLVIEYDIGKEIQNIILATDVNEQIVRLVNGLKKRDV